MLAQREAHASEAKRKAAEREATKEIMRKQKEEQAEKVRSRKTERDLKRQEQERAEAERKRACPARQRRADGHSGEAPIQVSAIHPASLQHVTPQIHSQATQNLTSTSADPRLNPAFTPTHYNIPPGTLNSQFLYDPMPWTFPPPSPTFTLHEASNGQGTSWIPTGPAIHMHGTRERGERGSIQ